MPRVPTVDRRADLAPEHQPVWDRIARSRGHVAGPFAVLLHRPELTRRIADVGAYIRYESVLPAADRELAILAVAHQMRCAYEWAAHVPEARKAGVRAEALAAVGQGRAAGLAADEAAVVDYVRQVVGGRRVDDATFGALRARLGVEGLVELTATAGYYTMLACTLNAFEVAPPPGAEGLPSPEEPRHVP